MQLSTLVQMADQGSLKWYKPNWTEILIPPPPPFQKGLVNPKLNCSEQQQKPEKEHQTAHAHPSPPPTQPPHIHTHKHTNNSANLLVSIWSLVPHRVESDGGIRVNLLHATDPLVHLTVYLCHPYIGGTLLQHLQKQQHWSANLWIQNYIYQTLLPNSCSVPEIAPLKTVKVPSIYKPVQN